jgi:hypothetical protein
VMSYASITATSANVRRTRRFTLLQDHEAPGWYGSNDREPPDTCSYGALSARTRVAPSLLWVRLFRTVPGSTNSRTNAQPGEEA